VREVHVFFPGQGRDEAMGQGRVEMTTALRPIRTVKEMSPIICK
jgi:hypothetical protein